VALDACIVLQRDDGWPRQLAQLGQSAGRLEAMQAGSQRRLAGFALAQRNLPQSSQ
jgi:hypothetical protein